MNLSPYRPKGTVPRERLRARDYAALREGTRRSFFWIGSSLP